MPRGRNKLIYNSFPGGVRGDLNPAVIPDGQWLSSQNWLVRNGVGIPRPGYSQIGSTVAAADAVTGIFIPQSRAYFNHEANMIVHTKTKAYYWDTSSWTDMTGTWSSSVERVAMIHYTSGGTAYILRGNRDNAIDYAVPGSTTAFANIAAAPSCSDMCAIGPYVLTGQPDGVKWNAPNDMTTWPASNEIVFQEIQGHLDGVMAVRAINNLTAVALSANGLWLCSLQAAKSAFRSAYYGEIVGPSSSGVVCQYAGKLYWIGSDFALWEFDGSSVRQLVSANADILRLAQNSTFAFQSNACAGSVVVPLREPEAWFVFQNLPISSNQLLICYNLKTQAATHHVTAHKLCSMTVGSLGSTEVRRRLILGDTTGKVFAMQDDQTQDAGTGIPWNFEFGYRPVADVGDRASIDAVASYFKKTSSSCTVTVGIALSDGIDDSETPTTSTFDVSVAGNHLKEFRGNDPKKWTKLKYSGTSVVAGLEYRGSIITSWPRSMV